MEQEQRLQLKMLFLLAYNLKIVISGVEGRGGGGGGMSKFSAGGRGDSTPVGETLMCSILS